MISYEEDSVRYQDDRGGLERMYCIYIDWLTDILASYLAFLALKEMGGDDGSPPLVPLPSLHLACSARSHQSGDHRYRRRR